MPEYVLSHQLKAERARLALMSELLDPMHRRRTQTIAFTVVSGFAPGAWRCRSGCDFASIE